VDLMERGHQGGPEGVGLGGRGGKGGEIGHDLL
jgi:hypothetical protein